MRLLAALACGVAASLAASADSPRPVAAGETLESRLPLVGDRAGEISFVFDAVSDGPVAVEVRSTEFDPLLRVEREGDGGAPVVAADGGGAGDDARAAFAAAARSRYRIVVRSARFQICAGAFRLSIRSGAFPAPDDAAETAYWSAVEASGRGHADAACRVEARLRLAARLDDQWDRGGWRVARGALALAARELGPDHPAVSEALLVLGLCPFEQIAGTLPGEEPLPPELHAILDDAADADRNVKLLERAYAGFERRGAASDPRAAQILAYVADAYRYNGALTEARPKFERALGALAAALGPDDPWIAEPARNFASLLDALDDAAGARREAQRARRVDELWRGAGSADVGYDLRQEAAAEPDDARAIQLLEAGAAGVVAAYGPRGLDAAIAFRALGDRQFAAGRLADARATFERTASIFGAAGASFALKRAEMIARIAQIDIAEGKPEAARARLAEAVAAEMPASSVRSARGLERAGAAYLDLGDAAAAIAPLERAVRLLEGAFGADHPSTVRPRQLLARALAARGELDRAFALAAGSAAAERRDLAVALAGLPERQALAAAARGWTVQGDVVAYAARLGSPAAATTAFDEVVRSRSVVFDETARRRIAARGEGADAVAAARRLREASGRLAALLAGAGADGNPASYRARIDAARRDVEAADLDLAERSARHARTLADRRVGLAEVTRALGPDDALVGFVRHAAPAARGGDEARYAAFVLRGGDAAPRIVPLGDAPKLDRLVGQWRAAVFAAASGGDGAAARRAGAALRAAVWDRPAKELRGARRVFLVPDGPLNFVDFAALPTSGGRYLVEDGPLLHLLSTERDLVHRPGAARGTGLLAVGGPDYDASRAAAPVGDAAAASASEPAGRACGAFLRLGFAPLPHAAEEAREVGALWPDRAEAPLVLTGGAATKEAFVREAPGRRALHLATHAFYLGDECAPAAPGTRGLGGIARLPEDRPPRVRGESPAALAGLVLAGANHRGAANADDGLLTAEEIAALDLSSAELAVLSACDTGLGELRGGEGVFGLRRAFLLAGARTVVTSLWPVRDDWTRRFMQAFYRGRFVARLDADEALRAAHLELLAAARAERRADDPLLWAGFVAVGDWR